MAVTPLQMRKLRPREGGGRGTSLVTYKLVAELG